METHSVPQNILDVEFKLFGSFTLKQFGKIIFGCLFGVGIFILPINFLIKFPLIAGVVLIGVMSALVPTFQVWITGFIRALFISPRYVWIKEEVRSDLINTQKKQVSNQQNVASKTNKKKLEIEDIPLDQLFTTRRQDSITNTQDAQTQTDTVKQQNLNRTYQDVFDIKPTTVSQSGDTIASTNTGRNVQVGPTMQYTIPQLQQSTDPAERMRILQMNLQMLDKNDPQFKQKQEMIMAQMNENRSNQVPKRYPNNLQNTDEKIVNAQGVQVNQQGQVVYGVVVDKKNQPIKNAKLTVKGTNLKKEYHAKTDETGRFATQEKLPNDIYNVSIKHRKHKFHTYKIEIGANQLPAYKFRTR